MIKVQFIPLIRRFLLFALAFLFSAGDAAALGIKPFDFCNNTCKVPGPCDQKSIAADCQKICKDDSIWKHVASLQMSSSSREFRMEKKDSEKKAGMLYEAPIAKCLGLTAKAEKAPPAPLPPAESSAKGAGIHSSVKDDLCAAAIKKEMEDLGRDKTALETQTHNLETTLKALQDKPAR